MFARVTNNENYDGILVEIFRDTQRGRQVSARRSAAENSLHSPEEARQFKRLAIGHVYHFVDVLDVHIRRNNFLTDTFDEVWSRLDDFSCFLVCLENRTVWIGADDPDCRILLF